MSKSMIIAMPVLAGLLLAPVVGLCAEGDMKWGASEQAVRTPAVGTNGFYEPEKVERDGDVIRFKMYTSVDPADKSVIDEVAINCDTREGSTRPASGEKREWDTPTRLFAGDRLYALARELCGWGPGFWKRLAD